MTAAPDENGPSVPRGADQPAPRPGTPDQPAASDRPDTSSAPGGAAEGASGGTDDGPDASSAPAAAAEGASGGTEGTTSERPVTSPGLPPSLTGAGRRRTVLTGGGEQHSVIQRIEERIGQPSRVLLRDEDSEHAASPVIQGQGDPGSREGLPGARGQYQVMGEIARGGMGVVLKGHDSDLGRDVAMKVLLEEHARSDSILQRFVEEAQVGGQLQHPGIVPVYELGLLEDDRPFFTMKLVKGRTLAALLGERRDVRDGRRRYLGIFEQVCQTIAYAHARKVIHRDLKPANIMVGAFGEVQVVDWGLSKVLREGGVADERPERTRPPEPVSIIETVRSGSSSGPGSHSLVGSVMGTPGYMSPEQAQGEIERLDERTDVFALGAILAEILCGRPPYMGEQDKPVVEAARALQDGVRKALDLCQAEPELIELALRCLSANRQLRPANAAALAQEVHDFLASAEERARQAELSAAAASARAEQERKARRVTLSLAAVALLAVVAGGWGWVQLRDQQADQLAADERRRSEVAAKVAGVLSDVQLHRVQERWDAARVALDQADTVLAASSDAPAGLADQVSAVRAELEAAARAASADREERLRVDTLLADLEAVQYSDDASRRGTDEHRDLAAAFHQAFVDFGVDPLEGDPFELASSLRATGRIQPVGLALDAWACSVLIGYGFDDPAFTRLIELAMTVDPDPLRLQLRRALLRDDRPAFERLAQEAAAGHWPPESVTSFCHAVRALGHRVDTVPMLGACQRANPDNVVIAMLLGWTLAGQDPPRRTEALTHFHAARALRPDFLGATNSVALMLVHTDRLREGMEVVLAQLARFPDDDSISSWLIPHLAEGLYVRGEVDMAVELLDRGAALAPDAAVLHNNLSWFLCVHPDPSRRDPQGAVAAARTALALEREQGAEGENLSNAYNTLGVALYRDGQYAEAVDALRRSMELGGGGLVVDWLVVGMALQHLGLVEEARPWYQRGMQGSLPPTAQDNWYLGRDLYEPMDEMDMLRAEARELFGDE